MRTTKKCKMMTTTIGMALIRGDLGAYMYTGRHLQIKACFLCHRLGGLCSLYSVISETGTCSHTNRFGAQTLGAQAWLE